MEVYSDIFQLGDGFIQTEGEPGGLHKANPIILGSFGGHYDSDGKLVGDRRRRRILFEDTFEETLAEFRDANWAITNGLTYWGRANTADAQSKMCAMIFDLDGQDDGTLTAFLYNCRSDYPVYPEPNYIILSGHNVHLYYVLEEPADLYPNTKSLLKDMKYHLTDRMWNKHTSREWEHPQHQGINQGFRVIGGKTKDGGTVRAFAVNTHPFSLEELNDFLPPEQQVDLSKKWRETRYTLEQAKERFPEWYEKVIVGGGRADGSWDAKEDLYNWWLRKIRAGATFSHRYFCLMALAIYAVKCGITDRERVKADMDSLVPFLDSVDTEHPFGNDHEVENALECLDLRYKKFPIKDLERISGIAIPKNKRNYRKQPQHMEYLNGLRKMRRDVLGENEYENSGRPKGSGEKCELIRSYAREHPDANHSDIAKALGVSITTLRRWEASGKLAAEHTAGGHRRYDLAKLKPELFRAEADALRRTVAYARVSSHDQKDDLERQKQVLELYCARQGWTFEVISDLGSGMNYHKKGLKKLLEAVIDGQIGRLVITHKDRLLRFGAELVFAICEAKQVEVVILNQGEDTTFEEDLAKDVLEIITVFSARLYGSRSRKNQKLLDGVKKAVEESQC